MTTCDRCEGNGGWYDGHMCKKCEGEGCSWCDQKGYEIVWVTCPDCEGKGNT